MADGTVEETTAIGAPTMVDMWGSIAMAVIPPITVIEGMAVIGPITGMAVIPPITVGITVTTTTTTMRGLLSVRASSESLSAR